MRNKHGSVLVITLGFVVAFTLLGMASLHYAMVQNEETERQKASMEAFWLADGAVEKAKALPSLIPKTEPPIYLNNKQGETDVNRFYDVHSRVKQDRKFRLEILAYGKVNGQSRYIKAELDRLNFPDYPFVTTQQPINEPIPPKIVEKIDHFDATACDAEFSDDKEKFDENFAKNFVGAACVNIKQSQHVKIPAPNTSVEKVNVLVIDVTEVNKLDNGTFVPVIEFQGPINGIVYVKGNLKFLENNLKITGELIVDGQVEFIKGLNQNEPEIVYNAQIVDNALSLTPQYFSPESFGNSMKIISWEEVSQLDEQI